jgi:predicted  nucleic acid-binding Zn-ribbon protein
MFHKCRECGRIIWFWQSKAAIAITLKNGKKEVLRYCLDCGLKLIERSKKASGEDADVLAAEAGGFLIWKK